MQKWIVARLDRHGTLTPVVSTPGRYFTPALSPDGQRLALGALTDNGTDIYVFGLQRGTMTRLTFTEEENASPVWAPDGQHLVFRTSAGPRRGIRWIRADASSEPVELIPGSELMVPYSIAADGRRLAYFTLIGARWQIKTVTLDTTDPDHPKVGTPETFAEAPFRQNVPVFSPDGRWITYQSDESGRGEIYVRPFPGPGGKWQVSIGGGSMPVWAGREIVFQGSDGRLWSSEVSVKGMTVEAAPPRRFSDVPVFSPGRKNFDVSADGTSAIVFPLPAADVGGDTLKVTMLFNFLDELRRH
jgi:serine/threonine-protein kinase